MSRVGFLGRLMLILAAALVALMTIIFGATRLEHSFVQVAVHHPRIVNAAGIITMILDADAARRQNVLRAANSKLLRVRLMREPPAPAPDEIRAPRSEQRLTDLIGTAVKGLQGYTTKDSLVDNPDALGIDGALRRVDVTTSDGQTLVIDWTAASKIASFTLLGLSPSVWAAILGLVIAALALATIFNEVRPLRRLTASVSAFDGGRIDPPHITKGAPDIRRLGDAVYRMQERVAALLRERSFLIGSISHDLRTFLTRLRLRTEDVEDVSVRERIAADLDSMTRMIETSLAFARGTASSLARTRIDLSDLVAIEVEEHNALGLPVALEGTYANDAIVMGDPVALRRVISNILDNALRFARATVKVRVDRLSAQERIVVEDDGPGIPDGKRDAIFSPFYRVERDRGGSTGGTGLGLAIARQIVEAHGGTIEVAAAAPSGAAFVIALPSCPR